MKNFIFLIIYCSYLPLSSQITEWHWIYKIYGSAGKIIRDIDLDSVGNIYLLVQYADHEIQTCNSVISSLNNGGRGNCIIKLNESGECLWALNLTSEFGEAGIHQLSIDPYGSIILTGYISGKLKIGFDYIGFENWELCSVLLKLSNDGKLFWWKYYRTKVYNIGFDHFSLDRIGNIYSTLFISGIPLEKIPIDSTIIQLKNNSLYARLIIVKWDENGNFKWFKSIENEGKDIRCLSTTIDIFGNLFIAGVFDSDSLIIDDYTVFNTRFSIGLPNISGKYDMYIAKLDSNNGSIKWLKAFGGDGEDYFWDIKVNRKGNIIIYGVFSSSYILFGTKEVYFINGPSSYNHFIISLNSNGILSWTHSYSPLSGWAIDRSSIDLDSADNIWFGVSIGSKININGNELTPKGVLDLAYLKFSNIGTIIDVIQFGEIGVICYPSPFIVDHSGALLISGSFVGDSLAVGPYKIMNDSWDSRKEKKARDFFLTKLIPNLISNGNDLIERQFNKISIQPNPANDLIQIRFDEDLHTDGRLDILTTTGSVMKSLLISKGFTTTTVDVRDWPAGVYFIHYKDGSGRIGVQKLVVE